jgi:hypothetical protein
MRDLEVWVPNDCIAASTAGPKQSALRWLRLASGLDTAKSTERSSARAGSNRNAGRSG